LYEAAAGHIGLGDWTSAGQLMGLAAYELFVQPAAGDSGCGLGAAMECARRAGRQPANGERSANVALGPAFDDVEIRATLDACGLRYRFRGDDIVESVASAIASGQCVGWFQGCLEAGPRALGQRSILAHPGTPSHSTASTATSSTESRGGRLPPASWQAR
jgi:carbamoyltransferase